MMKVIALFGPTAVGKTSVAIALADRLRERGEDPVAVSADALQVYRGLEVLTGAANEIERSRLEHRLISFVPVDQVFDVAGYGELAHAEIDRLLAAGRRPIVLGGTGLYLRAALCKLDLFPPPSPEVRDRLEMELAEIGAAAMHERLAALDAAAAGAIAPADGRRVVRALEALHQGLTPSTRSENRLWTSDVRVPTALYGLTMDRDRLYARIDARVRTMLENGAREEVTAALAAGAGRTARQALGFDELLADDEEAMRRNTRRYAKRQLTWMRKLPNARLIDLTQIDPERAATEIVDDLDRAV